MATAKQLAANRENAKKSTGPKTPEGKKAVALNALRHGLSGQVSLMPAEDREAHDKFCAAIVADLAPEGALETQLAQSIAEDNWRMNRARAIETNLFALGNFFPPAPAVNAGHPQIDAALSAAQVFAADPQKFQLLSLYLNRTDRTMQKALDRLRALQSERKALRRQDLEEAAARPEFNEMNPISQAAAPVTSRNGFVFSIEEIRRYLNRTGPRSSNRTAVKNEPRPRQTTPLTLTWAA